MIERSTAPSFNASLPYGFYRDLLFAFTKQHYEPEEAHIATDSNDDMSRNPGSGSLMTGGPYYLVITRVGEEVPTAVWLTAELGH